MNCNINVARLSGYCYGVERAIEITEKTLNKYKKKNMRVYSIGQIIHNPAVTRDLENKGLIVIKDEKDVEPGSVFIVRSHGIPLKVLKKLKERDVRIIDTACPFVKKAQSKAQILSKNGYHIVIIGDKNHPEVKSIADRVVNNNFTIVGNSEDLKNINPVKKIGVVIQTTQVKQNVQDIIAGIIGKSKKIVIENTICGTTEKRQQEAEELAKESDLVLVIGGKNSANTTHLAEIARKYNKNTYHIENFCEIKKSWLKNKRQIGITGGASTPKNEIVLLIEHIKNL